MLLIARRVKCGRCAVVDAKIAIVVEGRDQRYKLNPHLGYSGAPRPLADPSRASAVRRVDRVRNRLIERYFVFVAIHAYHCLTEGEEVAIMFPVVAPAVGIRGK